jgi:hypothetical protein
MPKSFELFSGIIHQLSHVELPLDFSERAVLRRILYSRGTEIPASGSGTYSSAPRHHYCTEHKLLVLKDCMFDKL